MPMWRAVLYMLGVLIGLALLVRELGAPALADDSNGVIPYKGKLPKANAMLHGRDGKTWLARQDELSLWWFNGSWKQKKWHHEIVRNARSVYRDPGDRIWVGSRKGGVARLPPVETYPRPADWDDDFDFRLLSGDDDCDTSALESAEVNAIHQDDEDVYWFGTNRGIFRYEREGPSECRFERIDTEFTEVRYIFSDRSGCRRQSSSFDENSIWFASGFPGKKQQSQLQKCHTGTQFRIDEGENQLLLFQDGWFDTSWVPGSPAVRALFKDGSTHWVATSEGIYARDGRGTTSPVRLGKPRPSWNNVTAIAVDRDRVGDEENGRQVSADPPQVRRIWLTTENATFFYDPPPPPEDATEPKQ